jgi:hypothetical protein
VADEQLSAELSLDIGAALSTVDSLGNEVESALGRGADSFAAAMADAVAAVPEVVVDPNVAAVEPAISDAVASADGEVPVEAAGADTITSDLDAAVAAADGTVAVDETGADTITGDISDAVTAADSTVAVTADISEAQHEISALDAAPIDIEVTADTTEAQGAIDDLGSSASSTGAAMSGAATSTAGFGHATEAAGAAAGLAVGSTSELQSAAVGAGGAMGAGVAAGGAFAVALGEIFNKGVEATSSSQRFTAILGPMAASVEHVNVGTLNTDLGKLATTLGTNDAALHNTAATLDQYAKNSGASDKAAAQFTDTIIALASRAVALNPALGSVSDVADAMATRLARGGRFAASFGISLTAAEISAKASADANGKASAELSIYEKAAAAATLATAKYGDQLGSSVATGATNATIVQRRLREEFNLVLETVGKTVVIPMFDAIQASLPIISAFATAIGRVGADILPAVTTALQAVTPVVQALADVLDFLGPAIVPVVDGFLAFRAIEFLPAIFTAVSTALYAVAGSAPVAAAGIEATAVAADEAAIGIAGALGPIGIIIGGLALGAAAFGLFGGGADESNKSVKDLTATLTTAGAVIDDTASKALRQQLQTNNQIDDLGRAKVSWSDYTSAVQSAGHASSDSAGHAQELLDALNTDSPAAFSEHMHNADKTLGDFTASTDQGKVTNQAFVSVLSSASPALGAMARQLVSTGQANDGLKKTILEQIIAQQAAGNATRDLKKIGADDASVKKEQTAATNELAGATVALATSALPELSAGYAATKSEQQSSIVALTDGVAALARYEGGALSLADATTMLDAAQKALPAAVLGGNVAYAQQAAAAIASKKAIDDAANSLIASITPLASVADGTRAYNAEVEASTTAYANAKDAHDRYAAGTLSAKEAVDALNLAQQALNATLDISLGRFVSQEQAHIAFDTSLTSVNDALAKNGLAIGIGTAAAEANYSAVNQAASAATAWSASIAANGGTLAEQQVPLQSYGVELQTLRDNLANAGADTSFVDGLITHNNDALAHLQASVPVYDATGTQIGTALKTGADAGSAGVTDVVLNNTGNAAAAVSGQTPIFDAHGNALGSAMASGAGSGASATSGAVTGEVDRAANDAALAGANMHNIGYGIGASFSAGIGDGIYANEGYVAGAATAIVNAAIQAAHDAVSNPPFPSREGLRIGASFGYGIAAGIASQAATAAAESAALIDGMMGSAASPFTPIGAFVGGSGPSSTTIEFNVHVSGVTDPALARTVGEQVVEGAADALTRRGIVTTARMG